MAEEFGDFSHHREIDVNAYFDQGYQSIAWKVTEATGYEDPKWAAAYRITRQRGKRFMGYHFDRAMFSGADQFDFFYQTFMDVAGSIRPGLDVLCDDLEDTQSPGRANASMHEFVNRAIARGVSTGKIYSGAWYATPYKISLAELPTGWRSGWLSDYTPGQPDSQIELPAGWLREWVFARQYTSTKPWPGQSDGVDFSRILTSWSGGEEDMPLTDDEKQELITKTSDLAAQKTWALVAKGLSDPTHAYLQDELQPLKDALAQVRTGLAAQADDEAKILGALGALNLNLTDEQIQEIASHVQIPVDKIREAVQFQITWPNATSGS